MAILSEEQITAAYFKNIGGFPSQKIIQELSEYDGGGQACIACTQLVAEEGNLVFRDIKTYSEREKSAFSESG